MEGSVKGSLTKYKLSIDFFFSLLCLQKKESRLDEEIWTFKNSQCVQSEQAALNKTQEVREIPG